jgi:hypothetical protein
MREICGTCKHFHWSEWKNEPKYETSYCDFRGYDVPMDDEYCLAYERSLINTIKYYLFKLGERRA